VPATGLFDESTIRKVVWLIVDAVIGSLNVAVATALKATCVVLLAGVTEVTVGPVVLPVGTNITSTQ